MGYDGQWKEIIYHEPDRVQVVVRASVVTGTVRRFRYTYDIANGKNSSQDVFGVAIQTFAEDVRMLEPSDGRYIGRMTRSAPEFAVGVWYRVPFEAGELAPGSTRRIAVESDAPPGLVYVRAHGGPLGMKGVGEAPPEVLEASLPRYEAWPLGITVGPVGDLRSSTYPFGDYSAPQLLEVMTQAGWLGTRAMRRYERLIERASTNALSSALGDDVSHARVAPEVAHALERIVADLPSHSGATSSKRENPP